MFKALCHSILLTALCCAAAAAIPQCSMDLDNNDYFDVYMMLAVGEI